MDIGMLWRDDDQNRTLEEKISRAAQYYRDKYGQAPNMCFVNGNALEEEAEIATLLVRPAKNVLPQHFWIGIKATQVAN